MGLSAVLSAMDLSRFTFSDTVGLTNGCARFVFVGVGQLRLHMLTFYISLCLCSCLCVHLKFSAVYFSYQMDSTGLKLILRPCENAFDAVCQTWNNGWGLYYPIGTSLATRGSAGFCGSIDLREF
jgi:hypothetical protein